MSVSDVYEPAAQEQGRRPGSEVFIIGENRLFMLRDVLGRVDAAVAYMQNGSGIGPDRIRWAGDPQEVKSARTAELATAADEIASIIGLSNESVASTTAPTELVNPASGDWNTLATQQARQKLEQLLSPAHSQNSPTPSAIAAEIVSTAMRPELTQNDPFARGTR